jgi:predicted amidohydrolase
MIVAGVQLDLAWENPLENFRRAREHVQGAAAAGARLAVLPEMFATGFSMRADRVAAFGDEVRAFLGEVAAAHRLWVLGGYAERGEPRPWNACSLMDPGGAEVFRYHKIHPFSLAGEHLCFGAGSAMKTAVVEGLRVTPVICYDLRFPELFRRAAEATDLFVVIANWPDARRDAWSTLLRARAIENQAYVLGVNRVGEGDGLAYSGDSALIDPLGRVQAAAAVAETTFYCPVDAAEVQAARARFSFLADRRPDLYPGLPLESP